MKRRLFKLVLFLTAAIIIGISSLAAYVKLGLPDVGPAPYVKIDATPQQIARGDYLANNVMVCMQCHSQRDWTVFGAPIKPGTEGMGGEVHDQTLGFPGRYVSCNITPFGLANWTDGELFRAITTGVTKDGKALFPIMPHPNFGRLDAADIKSVIAYLRTLAPIEFVPEKSYSDFPMNLIINTIPQKAQLAPIPPKENVVAYGKYLAIAGSCFDCHTKMEDGAPTGPAFAGGMEFTLEDGSIVRSQNLTPHVTGIGSWTPEQFVRKFKTYSDTTYVAPKVQQGDFQTVMPWYTYAGMTEEDLLAIYQYLKSLTPIENVVERFTSSKP